MVFKKGERMKYLDDLICWFKWHKVEVGVIIIIITIFAVIIIMSIRSADKENAENKIVFTLCKSSGGIPIKSYWDGSLNNCIYPPIKEKE